MTKKLPKERALVRPSPNTIQGVGGIDKKNAHEFFNHAYEKKSYKKEKCTRSTIRELDRFKIIEQADDGMPMLQS